ncbi:MAG: 2-(1,2-epoxy-1,2-dihydrophenyl)acetyl-CoA isomerase [Rhodobacteraceae bacterium GWE1_64_9]|nr:MAG: 2-(1,2-epoxy-1,2-dihydrophenyl)acetyl-CoA isomerase [Rhodobacteraceae bacterium GWE1_64_9]OHC50365.1 MAG: 2-(1,2-epoxy-1,2-dihydrophenyl)acetyl-CoA isomerase [Rhodobacteraceae bacterium GWF1_65_7]HBU14625.1 2-(1,2-epoxy-1,2-dihydrophenyl)acetyl-CoA isomerase [Gemmobacter sp.]
MTDQPILLAESGGIATITLNRPAVMNALSSQLRADMLAAIRQAETRNRVIVFTGAGRAFCSGQDLADAQRLGTDVPFEQILNDEYVPLLRAIYDCPLPTIAAVNGVAAGAGANLALAADVVIATESASFVQAFTKIGLIPDAGGTWWLPRQIGAARAMGACLFADKITARQAESWGMIYEAVADAAFAARVAERAQHLAQGPTGAYRAVKQAIRSSFAHDLDAQLALEAQLQGAAGTSADFREGVAAFLEKRSPRFTGA